MGGTGPKNFTATCPGGLPITGFAVSAPPLLPAPRSSRRARSPHPCPAVASSGPPAAGPARCPPPKPAPSPPAPPRLPLVPLPQLDTTLASTGFEYVTGMQFLCGDTLDCGGTILTFPPPAAAAAAPPPPAPLPPGTWSDFIGESPDPAQQAETRVLEGVCPCGQVVNVSGGPGCTGRCHATLPACCCWPAARCRGRGPCRPACLPGNPARLTAPCASRPAPCRTSTSGSTPPSARVPRLAGCTASPQTAPTEPKCRCLRQLAPAGARPPRPRPPAPPSPASLRRRRAMRHSAAACLPACAFFCAAPQVFPGADVPTQSWRGVNGFRGMTIQYGTYINK